jgi:hypothetical protein
MIDYTNHTGIRAIREIVPMPTNALHFGSNQWHHEPQWLIDAIDVAKSDIRTFAVKDIHAWSPRDAATGRSMASYAKQLQASIERNARMKVRLAKVIDVLAGVDGSKSDSRSEVDEAIRRIIAAQNAITAIMKDEEPVW